MGGRRIFANTMKYVLMGTSSNFGNMFSAAGASVFLTFLHLLPSQILLNNLLYDSSQLAIPTDEVDPSRSPAPARRRNRGGELDHLDVPARRLGSHPGQHAVPGHLRRVRRGRLRSLRYLAFYFAAVLGAYFILYPGSRVTTWIFPVFLVKVPAWIWLGLWFLYQLVEGSFGLFNAQANGGGVAFFAHVGGFVFGVLVTRLLVRAGQATPQARYAGRPR